MVNKKQESGRNLLNLCIGVFIGAMGVNSLGYVPTLVAGVAIGVVGFVMSKSK